VGKKVVETGGVRLHSRIIEKPVEETIRLREEHVNVKRTKVDRPATDDDFAWWSGLTKADARAAIHTVEGLDSEVINGKTYWYSTFGTLSKQPLVRLLPSYDEYLVSYKDRSAMQRRVDLNKVGETFDFLGSYVITLNGQIVGRWARSTSSDAVAIALQLFVRLSRAELDAVEEQANRYAQFVGLPLKMETTKRKASSRKL
jgi:hypothetical protein